LCFRDDVEPQTAFADAAVSAPRSKSQLHHYARCEAFMAKEPTLQRYLSFLTSESKSNLMMETKEISETLVLNSKLTK
jgi:hypothetical protein